MRSRNAVLSSLLVVAIATPADAPWDARQPRDCSPPAGGSYHGQLMQPLSTFTSGRFRDYARGLNWQDDKGVNAAPRRGDCGPPCLYKGPDNDRDDDPKRHVLVSNHPICDAGKIAHTNLPDNGVLIGRLTHVREHPPGSPRGGDASYNVRRATPGQNPGRIAEHYVVVFPGQMFIDQGTYAIWKIVSTFTDDAKSVVVADSGLFRVCLPKHAMSQDTLASFRSCAEVSELHELSLMRIVQVRLLGDGVDSAAAQRQVFSRLVRADSVALSRLDPIVREIIAQRRRGAGVRDEEAEAEPMGHGPFVRAINEGRTRRFLTRYGELHVDAPLWYTCAEGCCSGEPW
jgi:hypothetical protein